MKEIMSAVKQTAGVPRLSALLRFFMAYNGLVLFFVCAVTAVMLFCKYE